MNRFLLALFARFKRLLSRASPIPPIGLAERISRFVFQRSHIGGPFGVRPSAFLPPSSLPPARMATSVFRTSSLTQEEVWNLGDNVVGRARGLKALASADLRVAAVTALGLSVMPAPEPHPLHADIVAWPAEKERRKDLALLLCQKATILKRT